MSDWNSLPVAKAEAFTPKKGLSMGSKKKVLPAHIAEQVTTGETFTVAELTDGRDARALIYAVRTAAKAIGKGLQVQIEEPDILLKDLKLDTPGPITLKMSTANDLHPTKGNHKKTATEAEQALAVDDSDGMASTDLEEDDEDSPEADALVAELLGDNASSHV